MARGQAVRHEERCRASEATRSEYGFCQRISPHAFVHTSSHPQTLGTSFPRCSLLCVTDDLQNIGSPLNALEGGAQVSARARPSAAPIRICRRAKRYGSPITHVFGEVHLGQPEEFKGTDTAVP